MNNYIVYIHTNKINNKKYVGITSQTPEERWCNGKGYNKLTQPAMAKAILKYGWDNFNHEIVFKDLSFYEAQQKEKELIEKYHTFIGFPECNGYNMTLGGEGSLVYDYKKIAELFRNGNTVSEILNIMQCSESTVTNALRNQGITKRQAILMHQAEQINWYDMLGNYLQSFDSVSEASRQTGITRTRISAVLNGKAKSSGNYQWKKGNDISNISSYRNNKFVPVDQYTLDGKYIATYLSFSEASRVIGTSPEQIRDAANGKQNTCYGFKWIRHEVN